MLCLWSNTKPLVSAVFAFISLALTAAASGAPAKVFIFAGQSNMQGAGTASYVLTAPLSNANSNIKIHGMSGDNGSVTTPEQVDTLNGSWIDYQPGKSGMVHECIGIFGPELICATTIQKVLGETIYIIKYGKGGTNLTTDWNPNIPGSRYNILKSKVNSALAKLQSQYGITGKVAGFFWMQGESDTFLYESNTPDVRANAYEANLKNLIAQVRLDFGDPNLPFVFGQISQQPPPYVNNPSVPDYSNVVMAAQQDVANTVPNTSVWPTSDLPKASDNIHFNTSAQQTLGMRFANGWFKIWNPVKNSSFEDNGQWTSPPSSWSNWSSSDTYTPSAGYCESTGVAAHTGKFHGTQWWNTGYSIATYQSTTLPNGTYVAKAWVQSSGGQPTCQFQVKGYGGADLSKNITVTSGGWTQISIPNIQVTNGQCQVGFFSWGYANQWLTMDDVVLMPQ